jgi:hypothetical protein
VQERTLKGQKTGGKETAKPAHLGANGTEPTRYLRMFGKRRIASAVAPPLAIYLKSLERDAKVDTGFSAQSNLCRLRKLICNQIYADCVDLSAIKSMQIA